MANFNRDYDPLEFVLRLRELVRSFNSPGSKTNSISSGSFNPGKYSPLSGDSSNLNEYIQDVMKQSFEQHMGQFMGQSYSQPLSKVSGARHSIAAEDEEAQPEIFETHEAVILRWPVPEQINERMLKVRVGGNKAVIKWGPGSSQEKVVHIPVEIKGQQAKASLKEHILEVKIPRDSDPDVAEIDIQRT